MIFRKKTALKSIKTGDDPSRIPKRLWNNKKLVLEFIDKYSFRIKYAFTGTADKLIDNFINSFKFTSKKLKADKEVILKATNASGIALQFASKKLKNDKTFILQVVKSNPYAFEYIPNEFKNDKDVVLEAVKSNPYAFEYIPNEFKNDKDVVLEAVKSNPYAFKYVPLDFFRKEEQLSPIIETIKISLKDRVGQDVSQEDQEYATRVIKMVKDTIAEKRKEIDKIEQEKIKIEQEKNEKAQRVEEYKDKIDRALEKF